MGRHNPKMILTNENIFFCNDISLNFDLNWRIGDLREKWKFCYEISEMYINCIFGNINWFMKHEL